LSIDTTSDNRPVERRRRPLEGFQWGDFMRNARQIGSAVLTLYGYRPAHLARRGKLPVLKAIRAPTHCGDILAC
jgi:hypothetical protein